MGRRREILESAFNRVEVWEEGDEVEFVVAGAVHAVWHAERLLTGYAWDALTAAVCLHADPPSRVLLLGLGGGTVARQIHRLFPQVEFTGVEIDPGMIALARRHMRLDDLPVEVVCEDAFAFLDRTPDRAFDWVLDDLYLARGHDVARPELPGADYLRRLQRWTKPRGGVAMNLVRGQGHRSVQSQARAAFRAGFSETVAVRPPYGLNETVAGTAGAFEPGGLHRFRTTWSHPEDRRRWEEIQVRRLGGRLASAPA